MLLNWHMQNRENLNIRFSWRITIWLYLHVRIVSSLCKQQNPFPTIKNLQALLTQQLQTFQNRYCKKQNKTKPTQPKSSSKKYFQPKHAPWTTASSPPACLRSWRSTGIPRGNCPRGTPALQDEALSKGPRQFPVPAANLFHNFCLCVIFLTEKIKT